MSRYTRALLTLAVPALFLLPATKSGRVEAATSASNGSLEILDKSGKITGSCPLKHTGVRGAISGFVTRVTVMQLFENASTNTIEAIYTFPLPENAAVDDMTIQVGDRTVRGLIKEREEARKIYEKAIRQGRTAALLDQQRPNIFTQTVGNIPPGEQVSVTISYVDMLRYEEGAYEFVFPMVVGPRYIPGDATGKQGGGWAPDTDQVPDASHITPPVAPTGMRAGHDISIELALDAGVPIQELNSKSHEIDVDRTGASSARVKLKNQAEIPNKDFILRYEAAGGEIADAVLVHASPSGSKVAGGYFSLILQPPARFPESDVTPKELVFVLDTSGSMMGFPIEKAKEVINRSLDELYPGDTFNMITFAGDTEILFPEPVFPTAENVRKAKKFLESRSGGGGTEMMKAIRAALEPSDAQDRVRVVCFLTDGQVGNDMAIIGEVQKHPNARVFSFGIGTSVNRFLLSKIAEEGRGAAEFVTLADKAETAAHRFYERVRSPLLTDVSLDWGKLPVEDVYPRRVQDLFSGQPVIVTGRFTAPAAGTVRLHGKRAGGEFVREIPVNFSADATGNQVLATFWARRRVDELSAQDWNGAQQGAMKPALQREITQLGLDYRLMTQFTSFVAVEERVVTKEGKPVRVQVPVEMPEGVSYEGVFGETDKFLQGYWLNQSVASLSPGVAGGIGGGSFGALTKAAKLPAPAQAVSVTGAPSMVAPPPPPTPKVHTAESAPLTRERAQLESKLHPAVLAAYDCWAKRQSVTTESCQLPADDKLEVQIWLTESSAATLDAIKALGCDITHADAAKKLLTGRLPVEKLQVLTQVTAVRFVAPLRK
jgi:Ca-activated chloride channel homolog